MRDLIKKIKLLVEAFTDETLVFAPDMVAINIAYGAIDGEREEISRLLKMIRRDFLRGSTRMLDLCKKNHELASYAFHLSFEYLHRSKNALNFQFEYIKETPLSTRQALASLYELILRKISRENVHFLNIFNWGSDVLSTVATEQIVLEYYQTKGILKFIEPLTGGLGIIVTLAKSIEVHGLYYQTPLFKKYLTSFGSNFLYMSGPLSDPEKVDLLKQMRKQKIPLDLVKLADKLSPLDPLLKEFNQSELIGILSRLSMGPIPRSALMMEVATLLNRYQERVA